MEKITGIGGAFFRAKDPKMLAKWYEDHLGIKQLPDEYGILGWRSKGGATVVMPFDDTMDDFKNIPNQDFMFNFRVADMGAMIKQLRHAGIKVKANEKSEPNGKFALLADPEGNMIELWEPAGIEKDVEEK